MRRGFSFAVVRTLAHHVTQHGLELLAQVVPIFNVELDCDRRSPAHDEEHYQPLRPRMDQKPSRSPFGRLALCKIDNSDLLSILRHRPQPLEQTPLQPKFAISC
jgi:hypothetical protein